MGSNPMSGLGYHKCTYLRKDAISLSYFCTVENNDINIVDRNIRLEKQNKYYYVAMILKIAVNCYLLYYLQTTRQSHEATTVENP